MTSTFYPKETVLPKNTHIITKLGIRIKNFDVCYNFNIEIMADVQSCIRGI